MMDNPLQSELLSELTREYFEISAELRRLKESVAELRADVERTFKSAGFQMKSSPSSRNDESCPTRPPEESEPEHTSVEDIPDTPLDRAIREETRLAGIVEQRDTIANQDWNWKGAKGPGWLRPGRE